VAKRSVLEGYPGPLGCSLLQQMRDVLDDATRVYLALKDEGWGPQDAELARARGKIRGSALVLRTMEDPYQTHTVVDVEKMSVRRVRTGRTLKHVCGGLMLVNGMCARGHDPSGH
jgi:hypothetical protein